MISKFKKVFLLIILIIFSSLWMTQIHADNDSIWGLNWSHWKIKYCNAKWKCWLNAWIEEVKKNLWDEIVKDKTASEYIQNIVKYLLWFVTLIAVIYVIYAWFRILTSNGEDDTIKNSKKTIMYVIIWIVLIWFAYSIAYWATTIWEEAWKLH